MPTRMPRPADCAVGSELRSSHGTRWVKAGRNCWYARGSWGELDKQSVYADSEVYGDLIGVFPAGALR